MDDDGKYIEEDSCETCKSFSKSGFKMKKGFCMKLRKAMKRTDVCGYYRPDVKVEYQMECKPPERTSAPPKNYFSN